MCLRRRQPPLALAGLSLLMLPALLGCPAVPPPPSPPDVGLPPKPPLSTIVAPSPTQSVPVLGSSETRKVPLVAGEVPPHGESSTHDEALPEGDASWGVELPFSISFLGDTSMPMHLGAVPNTQAAARASLVGTMTATLFAGRMRLRFGARAFATEEGWELRADTHYDGFLLVLSGSSYRVVPSGALRALLMERRTDVLPAVAAQLGPSQESSVLGRTASRTVITTSYGRLELDQIGAPLPAQGALRMPSATLLKAMAVAGKADAATTATAPSAGLAGAGELLCQVMLEWIVADRSHANPCGRERVPVRAELRWRDGSGLVVEATALREASLPRAALAFPEAGLRLVPTLDGASTKVWISQETSKELRPRGDLSALQITNASAFLRVALIDGLPAVLLPPGNEATLALRAGRYLLEWRTLLGERVDGPIEVAAPGRALLARPSELATSSVRPQN